jgi:F0F1-type ATP synthase assembly protein I
MPYGPPDAKLYQLVHDLGADQAIFLMAMAVLGWVTTGRVALSVVRGASSSALPTWTLCVTVVSVSGWTFATLLALMSTAAVTAP